MSFLAAVGERPSGTTIDRIDVNGNYEAGNVRWATMIEQLNNKRNNRRIEWRGRVQTLAEWSREVGIRETTLAQRINHGWSLDEAMTAPVTTANGVWHRKHRVA